MKARPERAKLISALMTLAILVIVLAAARPQGGVKRGPAASPEDLIYERLTPAMRRGDVRGYLACFDGGLRRQLDAAVAAEGRAAFGEGLRQQSARTTGIAVDRVETAGDEASLRLVWVYRDDSDEQTAMLRRTGAGWRITGLTTTRRSRLPVPYGTEVIPGLGARPAAPEG